MFRSALVAMLLAAAARAGAQSGPPLPVPPAAAAAPAVAIACGPARTALVLSGGGGKGFAHIGVLAALDSMGVKPDLIIGTSVGAIMGGLYATGYSAHEIDSLMRVYPLEGVIRRYEPSVSASLGLLKPIAVWERGRAGYVLQTGTVREGEVNAMLSLLMLRGNLIARGDFRQLPIPFWAVTTDIVTRGEVVLSRGDLAKAVRASAALPLVFGAVHYDSLWLIDGAFSDNTPVMYARELGAERVWVSRLPFAAPHAESYDDPLKLSEALINSLFKEDSIRPRDGDVVIDNPTSAFQNLDFRRATSDSLTVLGRSAARAAFAAAPCINPLGGRKPRAMPTQVTTVSLRTRTADGAAVVAGLGLIPGGALNTRRAEVGLAELAHSERYRGVWLHPSGEGTDVAFRPELEPAPDHAFGVGVAFDQFMSGRIWVGGVNRSVLGGRAEGAGIVRLGSYAQDAMAFLRLRAKVLRRSFPLTVATHAGHETVRLFDSTGEAPSAETQEIGGFVGVRADPQPNAWRYVAGLDFRVWRAPNRPAIGSGGVRASLFRARNAHEMGTIAEALALADFQRIRVDASRSFNTEALEVRLRTRVGWGHRLPIQYTFALGGPDGFAGEAIGDLRGSQEAFGSLQLRRRIAPGITVVAEGMAGAVGTANGFLIRRADANSGKWFGGVRAGFEVNTPIGPIRVEEGFSSTGKRALLFRVGYWF